ncbi:mitochondrial 18 KDa protein-domain-containing protein [Cantharellus anzutake]|uniref:mitochondrial 18 KDa protein-domain-containing protein n=1 Tax=Cantharellus anzutake TaxID=1750568 RepID=UPI001906A895|nr:mitochondrial 18 KDa protein-domain-containing protein [Cantharellus anzutake]KAF8341286.1 mitochondrial 18 KDa protein-domain-containing protein [Cantharellus anzutake]
MANSLEDKVDSLANRNVSSTDTDARYLAYTSRVMTAVRASSRYIAYTSDLGEAFRPVVHPAVVTACYAVSWLYLSGDVAFETYKAKRQGPTVEDLATWSEPTRLTMTALQRSVFQSIASMALPAFTIHSVVRYSVRAFNNAKSPRVKAWGPSITGLAVIPVLPFLYDHPVETATEAAFGWIKERIREGSGRVPPSKVDF